MLNDINSIQKRLEAFVRERERENERELYVCVRLCVCVCGSDNMFVCEETRDKL